MALTSMDPGAGEQHLSHVYQRTVSLFSQMMPHTRDAPQICCLLLFSLPLVIWDGGIHLQASRRDLTPNRLRSPPFRSYLPPPGAFLPSWVHIFSSTVRFVQLLRLSDEDMEDRFNAVNLIMHPPTPPPRFLHAHMHLIDSASMTSSRFSMHTHPLQFPCTKKAKIGRKHSYCLLQSLMKTEIPPLEKSGGAGWGGGVKRRGGEAQRLAAAEESAVRRGQREVGGEEQLEEGEKQIKFTAAAAAAATAKTLLLHCRHEELKGAPRAG